MTKHSTHPPHSCLAQVVNCLVRSNNSASIPLNHHQTLKMNRTSISQTLVTMLIMALHKRCSVAAILLRGEMVSDAYHPSFPSVGSMLASCLLGGYPSESIYWRRQGVPSIPLHFQFKVERRCLNAPMCATPGEVLYPPTQPHGSSNPSTKNLSS